MRWRFLLLLTALAVLSCGQNERPLAPKSQTWAELRTVRRGVTVTPPGGDARAPYPRDRLVDGAKVSLEPAALAWLRRDGGATLLIHGPGELALHPDTLRVDAGRVFVESLVRDFPGSSPQGGSTRIDTPAGPLVFAAVRASLEIGKDATQVYVLSGEVRVHGDVTVRAGESATLKQGQKPAITPTTIWEDWTGGLATTDRAASPAPFGVGTVGAREPSQIGAPRFALAIQQMRVNVTIDGDFAVTEVDQRFFNPSSKTVEGIYRFRTPRGASLYRFGVDRAGELTWGRVKEREAAAAQYQSNVYQGSTEDPALLEWEAPGVYRARLYPIAPGETRRVVVRYSEWLGRSGAKGERRVYVYPMAAEGTEASLPLIEELTLAVDVSRSRANDVRVGMAGVRKGGEILIREQDYRPRADLTVELFDDGSSETPVYRAKHRVDPEVLAPDDRGRAAAEALKEADYVLVPVRAEDVPVPQGGLDLAIVVDASAANEQSSMALARAMTSALLSHLGDDDRAVVWTGAETLTPVVPRLSRPAKIDGALRQQVLSALATRERGGATDVGAMLSAAAAALDKDRRGAVVYIGDARATVGELSLSALRDRLAKLPRPVRVFGIGVGDGVDMAVLDGLSVGAFAAQLEDAHGAARTALELFEVAERPAWLGVDVDLGQGVERVYPRKAGALLADETLLVVGRIKEGATPSTATLRAPDGERRITLKSRDLADQGDLRRRWAEGRMAELFHEQAGRAALVDLGMRFGVITPVTSYYVPTARELDAERTTAAQRRQRELEAEREMEALEETEANADNKEGGTGTRAKGEEGSMGRPTSGSTNKRYAVRGPKDNPDPHVARQSALKEAQEFGMTGLLNAGAGGDPNAPTAPWGRDKSSPVPPREDAPAAEAEKPVAPDEPKLPSAAASTTARGNMWGDEIADAPAGGGLGLSGIGEGGGGKGEGLGLGKIGTLGHGAGTGTGQGFGSGHGRLGGGHKAKAPSVRMGATKVTGRLPPEVVQRIVRQNFGRFRLCYEQGLGRNPNLEGRVSVRFLIGTDGSVESVQNAGSDLPDGAVVTCVTNAFTGLSFPQPEGGIVTVTYPISFTPGDATPERAQRAPRAAPGLLPRFALRCAPAANLPFYERIQLWRERLAPVSGNPSAVYAIYRAALDGCEATTWGERRRLLSLLLDALPTASQRVTLWRLSGDDARAADTLYRGLVARVRTPEQMRELHQALGLKHMDRGALEKTLKDLKDPAARVKKLRALAFEWPDDFDVQLALLHALEDAGDDAAARDLAARLRRRPDADAHLRTAVGELHLRLAARAAGKPAAARDQALARSAFGEIVEFAPDDPVARRRLGDLLRAHGWYADAARQYETLAQLTPDDPSVALLLAAAAQGEGQLEAAVRWTEKGRGAGAPDVDSGPAVTSRAFAATYLAWGRLEARNAKQKDVLDRLASRAKSVLATERAEGKGRIRATLTWSHPELHPMLFSNALGAPMPATEGDVTLGLTQARMAKTDGAVVEVRLDPGEVEAAARLGAEAVLTVVFDELEATERIARVPLRFEKGGPPTLRFRLRGGEVTRE